MSPHRLHRFVAVNSGLSATMLLGMFAMGLASGGFTPQRFETVFAPDAYAAALIDGEWPMRVVLTLDNLFLTFYTAAFIFLAVSLWDVAGGKFRLPIGIGLGLTMVTTVLDLHENHDLLTQLTMALQGLPLELADIRERMIWSQLKFHCSYVGLFLIAFALPHDTAPEKLLKYSLWAGYLPVGIAVYTFPHPLMSLLRIVLMLSGFVLLGWTAWQRAKRA